MLPPRERPVIPMRRNFSEFYDRQVLPFYIVCDESDLMEPIGGITTMNQALPDVYAELASDPLISDFCLIGLITFAETAEELMQLTKLSDVVAMPGLQARGPSKYGPVFTLLREVIERDVENLKFYRAEYVFRPAVFFITAGNPTDDLSWESDFRSLMDKSTFRYFPNIISFGVSGANAVTIGKIGTVGAFIGDNEITPADSLSEIVRSLIRSGPISESPVPMLTMPVFPSDLIEIELM
jgi:uncharacterized protein YegL